MKKVIRPVLFAEVVSMNRKSFESPIAFNGQAPRTVETEGKQYFILTLPEINIPQYQKTVLVNGLCPKLLTMRFIAENNRINAYYRWDGFVQLRTLYKRWKHENRNIALETIEIISSVIQCVVSIENYLFITDGYQLNCDIVFVHPKARNVKLAFVPTEKHPQTSLVSNLMNIIESSMKFTDDEQWRAYGKEILESIIFSEDSLISIEKKLHRKARTIYSVGWPKKSELRSYMP